jgi:hypothetical protein
MTVEDFHRHTAALLKQLEPARMAFLSACQNEKLMFIKFLTGARTNLRGHWPAGQSQEHMA